MASVEDLPYHHSYICVKTEMKVHETIRPSMSARPCSCSAGHYHSVLKQSILWASGGLTDWWPIVISDFRMHKQEKTMQTAYHWLERGVLFQNISSPYPKITRNKEHIARNGSPVLRPRDSWYSNNMQQQNNLIRCLIQVSQPTPNSVREKHAWYSFMGRLIETDGFPAN